MNELQQGQEYVNRRRAEGMSDDGIRQELFNSGWTSRQIQDALSVHPSKPSITPPAPNAGHRLSKPLIVLALALVLLVAIGALAAVFFGSDSNEAENSSTSQQESSLQQVSTNDFSISIPNGWKQGDSVSNDDIKSYAFYSPEHESSDHRDQSISMEVLIISKSEEESLETFFGSAVTNLESGDPDYEVVSKENIKLSSGNAYIAEFRVSNSEKERDYLRSIVLFLELDQVFYQIQALTAEENMTEEKRQELFESLKSIKPFTVGF